MERYAMRGKDGSIYIKDTAHLSEEDLISFLSDKLAEQEDKLSAYEDPGLTPEEIKDIQKEVGLYKEACQRMVHISINKDREITNLATDRDYWKAEAIKWCNELGEIKIAEEQGLLIKLPLKPGDKVFVNIKCFSSWFMFLETRPYVRCEVINIKATKSGTKISIRPLTERTANSRYHRYFGIASIGKTAFLTREAAEAALKGGASDE